MKLTDKTLSRSLRFSLILASLFIVLTAVMAIALSASELPVFVNNGPPALNATNLNNITDAIQYNNAIVYIDGTTVIARDNDGGVIASGTAGTDDADVIQAAVDSMPLGGRVLIRAAGTAYILSHSIHITTDGITIEGESRSPDEGHGMGTYLKLANGVNDNMFHSTGKKTQILRFLMDGNKNNNGATSNGIEFGGGSIDPYVMDCYIFYFKNDGIRITAGDYGAITNTYQEFNGDNGINVINGNRNFFNGVWSSANGKDGFSINGGDGNILIGCRSYLNTQHGFTVAKYLSNIPQYTQLMGCWGWKNNQNGIWVVGAQNTIIDGCVLQDSGQGATNTYDGIKIETTAGVSSLNNTISNNQIAQTLTNKLKYGINVVSADNDYNIITNNVVTGAQTAEINSSATHNIIKHNSYYYTENSGTATVPNGATYIDVAHGLSITPSINNICVTPTNNMGSAAKFWISNVDATNFRINVDADPGAGTATFSWSVV